MTRKNSKTSTIRFISSHTHAGTQYVKGDELEADPGLVARLKRFGVIDEGKRHATDKNDKD